MSESSEAVKVQQNTQENLSKSGKKRKRKQFSTHNYYDGLQFIEREKQEGPGVPHRFFSSSYTVTFSNIGNPTKKGNCTVKCQDGQIVHRHANGLAIVTVGDTIQNYLDSLDEESTNISIQKVEFMQKVTTSQSVGGKRRNSKHQNSNTPGSVSPLDTLALVTLSNGEILEMKCCIAGTLLELNTKFTTEKNCNENFSLLMKDPLLDGYLAVILPSTFPDSKSLDSK
ncbi:hypothetical protein CTEN210_05805 [Chaetoceros tenuissimus]|uniref:Protein Abitram n=1 Tax=Chaetoceros tenuissimus TaxID=426638 RepID=A0AAD3CPB2_9STRA|nr:hypothetical protein CTEN210_05805 [Chaetoceros tenuissimus]